MAEGRNPDGTFTKGHKHSEGTHTTNRKKLTEALRRAFLDDNGEPGEKFIAVRDELIRKALDSDDKNQIKAIELCLNYLIGKPQQSIDLEGLGDNLKIVIAGGDTADAVESA